MPLVNISLQQQQQSAAAGITRLPQIPSIQNNTKTVDEFIRAALNPVNVIAPYTVATTGAGSTGVINDNKQLLMTTDANIGDNVSVRTTFFFMRRPRTQLTAGIGAGSRSQLILDILFAPGEATDGEGFVGLLDLDSAQTAIPTTANHLGAFWNNSASANMFLSSANGATQTTTDTSTATNGIKLLRIVWTGDDAAELEIFNESVSGSTNFDNSIGTQTVTAIGMNNASFILHFFIETEAASLRNLFVPEWRLSIP